MWNLAKIWFSRISPLLIPIGNILLVLATQATRFYSSKCDKELCGKCLVPIRVQDIPYKGYDPNINVGLSQNLVISYLTSLKKKEVFLAFFIFLFKFSQKF